MMFYYLPTPKTKKTSFVGEGNGVIFGQSSMQGWRRSMEDNHICEPKFTENSSLFAVFDGHNGREVADFCAMHFGPQLQINQNFIEGYINIAQIYEREKNFFDADNHYQKAFSINKDHPALNRAYARFLINAGELKKGLSLMYKNFGFIRFGKSNVEIN